MLLAQFVADAQPDELGQLFDALAEAQKLNTYAADAIMLRWTAIDPAGAIGYASRIPTAAWSVGATMWAWANNDPEAALAYGLANGVAVQAVRAIAQRDPARCEAVLAEHPELDVHTVREGLVSGFGRSDDLSSARYALANGLDSDGALERIASSDPYGALDISLSESRVSRRAEAIDEVLAGVAKSDGIGRALELASALPPGSQRVVNASKLFAEYARSDPEAAARKARSLEQPLARDHALASIAQVLTVTSPDRALALLGETSLDRLFQGSTIEWTTERSSSSTGSPLGNDSFGIDKMLESLVRSRPVETFELLESAGDSTAVVRLKSQAAREWVENDPETASSWIGTLPSGNHRDTLVDGLTHSLIHSDEPDFEAALAWTLTMDPSRQEPSLETLFRGWQNHDKDAALAAMARAVRKEGTP